MTTEVVLSEQPSDQFEECPICWGNYNAPITTQCRHTFCKSCIRAHFQRSILCPMCRECIVDTTPSLEPRYTDSELITVPCYLGMHWGLTVSTCEQAACVRMVSKGDEGERQMLKPGDRILSINGIPCRTHEDCTRIIKQLAQRPSVQNVVVELRRRIPLKPAVPSCLHRLCPWAATFPRVCP